MMVCDFRMRNMSFSCHFNGWRQPFHSEESRYRNSFFSTVLSVSYQEIWWGSSRVSPRSKYIEFICISFVEIRIKPRRYAFVVNNFKADSRIKARTIGKLIPSYRKARKMRCETSSIRHLTQFSIMGSSPSTSTLYLVCSTSIKSKPASSIEMACIIKKWWVCKDLLLIIFIIKILKMFQMISVMK